ncbi:MAG: cation transporter [Planctomycetes bacterium]|nr:cation transporter [Planctomycetota bacterium]
MQDPQATRSRLLSPKGITWASLCVNMLLAAGKILAGIFCRSQTILADGLHSGSDLLTDFAVLAGLRVSNKPADSCHPYGHRRFSTLVALFVGAALAGAAAWIAYDAIRTFHNIIDGRQRSISAGLPFWLALVSAPVKEVMFRLTRLVGNRSSDVSLLANAWHHRTDAFTSVAAAIGLAGVLFGGPNWQFLDPLTATVLATFLLVVAWKIMAKNAAELVDRSPSSKIMGSIEQAVTGTQGVQSFHSFRARQTGGKVIVDIHVQVNPDITVAQGHEIASAVRRAVIQGQNQVLDVIVHVEPAERENNRDGLI